MPLDVPSGRPRPLQFGIGSLLLLTTLGAVVIGLGRMLNAPLVWIIGICAYCFFLLAYMAFRVPYLWRISFGRDSPWRRVQERRKELEAMSRRSTEPEASALGSMSPVDDAQTAAPVARSPELDPSTDPEALGGRSGEAEPPGD